MNSFITKAEGKPEYRIEFWRLESPKELNSDNSATYKFFNLTAESQKLIIEVFENFREFGIILTYDGVNYYGERCRIVYLDPLRSPGYIEIRIGWLDIQPLT